MSNEHHKIQEMPEGPAKQARIFALKQAEAAAEKERIRVQQEKEAAAQRIAAERVRLLTPLQQQSNRFSQQLKASEQKLQTAMQHWGSMAQQAEQLNTSFTQLHQYQLELNESLGALEHATTGLAKQVKTAVQQVTIMQEQATATLKMYQSLLQDAKKAGVLAGKNIADLQMMEQTLQQAVTHFQEIGHSVAAAESWAQQQQLELGQLEQQYQALSEEIRLLRDYSAVSVAAFVEIQALREQGYQLRGAASGQSVELWFEEVKGKKRVAMKLKNMVENQGITWLKELDLVGFDKAEQLAFIQAHKDELRTFKVSLKHGEKRRFPKLPPANLVQWQQQRTRLFEEQRCSKG